MARYGRRFPPQYYSLGRFTPESAAAPLVAAGAVIGAPALAVQATTPAPVVPAGMVAGAPTVAPVGTAQAPLVAAGVLVGAPVLAAQVVVQAPLAPAGMVAGAPILVATGTAQAPLVAAGALVGAPTLATQAITPVPIAAAGMASGAPTLAATGTALAPLVAAGVLAGAPTLAPVATTFIGAVPAGVVVGAPALTGQLLVFPPFAPAAVVVGAPTLVPASPLVLLLQVAFENNPFDPIDTLVWTDISQYVATLSFTMGRQHATDQITAGSLRAMLTDVTGAFTPANLNSPYYGNGVTTGLVPGKPVRVLASYNLTEYPLWYGYTKSWTPNLHDQVNQDVQLEAADILDMLGNMYLADDTLYPNLVLALNPLAYLRLGDDLLPTNITTNVTLVDSSGTGAGSGTLIVPSPPTPPQTPYATGGNQGFLLYDPTTNIALGNVSTAQSNISSAQSAVTYAQKQLASDQQQQSSDQTQANTDKSQLSSDLSEAVSLSGSCASGASDVGTYLQAILNQANADGYTDTINSARWTNTYFGSSPMSSLGSACNSTASSAQSAVDAVLNASTVAQAVADLPAALKAVQAAIQAVQNYGTGLGNAITAVQATASQASQDGDTNTYNACENALNALYGGYSAPDDASSYWQAVQGDLQAVQSDLSYLQSDQTNINADESALATAQTDLQNAVAWSSAYIAESSSAGDPYCGAVIFSTTLLPTAGVFNQTVAVVSQPTGGSVGAFQINSAGLLTFTFGGSAEITQPSSFTNASGDTTSKVTDGNPHMLAWSLSGIGGTLTMWLDGVEMGTFTSSGLYPGVEAAGNEIVLGGFGSGGSFHADFVGSLQEAAIFGAGALTTANVAQLYTTATLMRHYETTAQRTKDCLLIALGETAYNNVPINVSGSTVCFPEVNSTVQTQAMQYIGDVVTTEIGMAFQAPDGTFTMYGRNYTKNLVSLGVWGDNEATPYHYIARNFQVPKSDEDLWPIVQLLPSTGTQSLTDSGTPTQFATTPAMVQVQSNQAITAFGPRTLQVSSVLYAYYSDVVTAAELLLARYAFPLSRVAGLTLSSTNPPNLTQQLQRGIWDRGTTQRQGPGETLFSQDSVIEQIKHHWDSLTKVLETTYSLSPFELIFMPPAPTAPAGVTVGAPALAG
jgi:hypothetical protein